MPAVVTDVSWPSLAGRAVFSRWIFGEVRWRKWNFWGGNTHVGGYEHPLREFICCQVLVEHGEVFDVRQAVEVVGDGVINYCWILSLYQTAFFSTLSSTNWNDRFAQ